VRIVSLLPSATEIVCALGLGDDLVGVTHECDHPKFVAALPKVTRTLIPHDATSRQIDALVRERLQTRKTLYTLDLPTLERLAPDLIVTQALCDVCAVAEAEVTAAACALPGRPRVVNLEPTTLAEVYECLRLVGVAAGVTDRAETVVARLRERVEAVAGRTAPIADRPHGVVLEWIAPPFGSGHWTPELVRLAGGVEAVGRDGQPSQTTAWERVLAADPDWMLVACCGFDVARTMADIPILVGYEGFAGLRCARRGRVFVTDGNAYFSRPGPRLVDGLEILAHALHPDVHPLPAGLPPARRLTPAELGGGA
jgi:iron complex transport system substrate-binding protein